MMKQVQYLTHAVCTVLVLVALAGCTDEGALVGAEPPALRLDAAADALSGGSATADVRFRTGENAGKIAFAVQAAQTVSGYFAYQDLEGLWFEADIQRAPRIGDGRAAFGGPVTSGSVQFLVPTWLYAEAEDGGPGVADGLRWRFGPPDADFDAFDENGWTTATVIEGDVRVEGQSGTPPPDAADCLSAPCGSD